MSTPAIIPLLPSSLMRVPHIAAFDPIIRNYVSSDIDLSVTQQGVQGSDPIETVINVINIDTCPVAILPYLAEMFGVEGYKGFDYATTETQQRNMLRNAMLKQERHGTIWTLQTALEDAGYQNVVITDQTNGLEVFFFDGSRRFDGTWLFDSNEWADFTVTLDPPVGVPGAVDIVALTKYINYWKRGSSRLIDLTVSNLIFTNLTIGTPQPRYFDGSWLFDGTWTFSGF